MRRILAGFMMVSVLCGSAGVAFAQADQEVRVERLDLEALRIDGAYKKPDLMRSQAKDRARFDRLSRVKKSVLNRVIESAEEPAL